ncbi:MAG: UDP-N-acetylmuramoyl-tripeptide--D-alanyl-D-alanine ligase [Gemmatimonadales bacterium]
MTFWTSGRVAETLGVPAPLRTTFARVSTDTRQLATGDLFVALQGERFDAHDFLAAAQAQGAAAAVVRRGTTPVDGLPFFAVADTLAALGSLARGRRRALPAGSPVVAITGSSGKTSTKELVRAALAARYRVHATTGNLNNLVGVPLTILATPDDAEALVVEAGASLPGEIARLRDIIEPTIGVITNIGYAHVEGFGSLEGVLQEKLSLLYGVPLAVVGPDPTALAEQARRRTRTVVAGATPPADVVPDAFGLDDTGRCRLRWNGHDVTLPVFGLHQAENAMLALAVAREAGVAPDAALAALATAHVPGGRGRVIRAADLTIIDDTYNANPSSLRWAVASAARLAQARQRPLAVVVGSMLELGPESARLHAAAAADIMGRKPVLVGAVGEFAASFAPYRDQLGERLLVATDAEALGPRLKVALQGNEVVLLKASRGVALERVLRHLS